jgi:DNA-binding transcriptional regulator YhcF (GntR family)
MDSNLIKIKFFTDASEYTHTLEKNDVHEVLDSLITGMRVVGYTNNEIKEAFKQKFLHVLLNNN